MRIPRVIIENALSVGERRVLPASEAHHLVHVLRRGAGDEIEVVGAGRVYRARLLEGSRSSVEGDAPSGDSNAEKAAIEIEILTELEAPGLLTWTVAVAVVKGSAMDDAVRMASELGFSALVPLWCERCVVRPSRSSGAAAPPPQAQDAGAAGSVTTGSGTSGQGGAGPDGLGQGAPISREGNKRSRWQRLAAAAAKQCGRARPLTVEEPVGFARFLSQWVGRFNAEARWVLHPGAPLPGADSLSQTRRSEEVNSSEALFLIGPEGGFSAAEIAAAEAAGCRRLGLPGPVLRTPTAVAALGGLGLSLQLPKGK